LWLVISIAAVLRQQVRLRFKVLNLKKRRK